MSMSVDLYSAELCISTALCVLSGNDEIGSSSAIATELQVTETVRCEFQAFGPATEKARRRKLLSW